jgi:hypothetical protein
MRNTSGVVDICRFLLAQRWQPLHHLQESPLKLIDPAVGHFTKLPRFAKHLPRPTFHQWNQVTSAARAGQCFRTAGAERP